MEDSLSLWSCEVCCILGLPTVSASDLPEVMTPENGRAVPWTLVHLILGLLLFLFFQVRCQGFGEWIWRQTLLVDMQDPEPRKPSLPWPPLSRRNLKLISIQEGSITQEMWKDLHAHSHALQQWERFRLSWRIRTQNVQLPRWDLLRSGERRLFCHRDENLDLLSVAWREKLQVKGCAPHRNAEFWLLEVTLK